jgi:hypothetical protein
VLVIFTVWPPVIGTANRSAFVLMAGTGSEFIE